MDGSWSLARRLLCLLGLPLSEARGLSLFLEIDKSNEPVILGLQLFLAVDKNIASDSPLLNRYTHLAWFDEESFVIKSK